VSRGRLRDEWGTPQWLFDELDREFGFDLDAAATDLNSKCARHLEDALTPDPWPGERIWLNPPYSSHLLESFLRRADVESRLGKTIVTLLPSRTETSWWHNLVITRAAEIRFIRGRVAFQPPPEITIGPAGNRPVFASVLAIYRPPRPRRKSLVIRSMPGRRNSRNLTAGQKELPLAAFLVRRPADDARGSDRPPSGRRARA